MIILLAILLGVLLGVSWGLFFTRPRKSSERPVEKHTEPLDDYVPHVLWYQDVCSRLDKITTITALDSFDPYDYQDQKLHRKRDSFSKVNHTPEYYGLGNAPYPKSKPVKPAYLYAEYDETEVQPGYGDTKVYYHGVGEPIAVLADTIRDPITSIENDIWRCTKHPQYVMKFSRVAQQIDIMLRLVAKQFNCPECAERKYYDKELWKYSDKALTDGLTVEEVNVALDELMSGVIGSEKVQDVIVRKAHGPTFEGVLAPVNDLDFRDLDW